MADQSKPLVSIVSPIYRAENTLATLAEEVHKVFAEMQLDYELILVEDGSPDDSWGKIRELAKENNRIKGISLSRNYGQHYAITAGIDNARGQIIGVVDCDLEDHPKYFKNLIEKLNEGHDVVFARRQNKTHSQIRRILSSIFAIFFNLLTDLKHDSAVGTFSVMNRKVADNFIKFRESLRSYTILVHHMGFKRGYCEIQHQVRHEGRSNYSLKKLLSHTLHSTIIYTEKPLRAISVLGLFVAVCAFIFTIYIVIGYFVYDERLVGWSSLIASIYLTGGMILFALGIIGIYLGKCFRESLNRPLYLVKDTVN